MKAGVIWFAAMLSWAGLTAFPHLSAAQYFSSLSGVADAPPEARQASASALVGLASVLSALGKLEMNDQATASDDLEVATRSLSGSIAAFKSLKDSKIADLKIDPQTLHPDERSFISDPGLLDLGTNHLNTAGDVFALTAGALSVSLSNINSFRQAPSVQTYAVVRDDIALLLRIGQIATQLLKSAR